MKTFILLLGGFVIGSLIIIIIQHYLLIEKELRTRFYEDKRNAYNCLLNSLYKATTEPSNKNSQEFLFWQTHPQIICSPEVAKYVQKIIATNDGPKEEQHRVFENLVQAMKQDLKQLKN